MHQQSIFFVILVAPFSVYDLPLLLFVYTVFLVKRLAFVDNLIFIIIHKLVAERSVGDVEFSFDVISRSKAGQLTGKTYSFQYSSFVLSFHLMHVKNDSTSVKFCSAKSPK